MISLWNSLDILGKVNDVANILVVALSISAAIAGLVAWQTSRRNLCPLLLTPSLVKIVNPSLLGFIPSHKLKVVFVDYCSLIYETPRCTLISLHFPAVAIVHKIARLVNRTFVPSLVKILVQQLRALRARYTTGTALAAPTLYVTFNCINLHFNFVSEFFQLVNRRLL